MEAVLVGLIWVALVLVLIRFALSKDFRGCGGS